VRPRFLNPGNNPVVRNDPDLTRQVVPTLMRVAGETNVRTVPLMTGAEDFAYYAEKVPSFFYFVGITPRDQSPLTVASNHSPLFYVDEAGIPVAARSLANVAIDYLQQGVATERGAQ
jgi:metal-dependent amidase/aminoacylase/carboxypeptidase family protein